MVKFTLTKTPERFMKSSYKIIWSDEAYKNLKYIIGYLEKHWTVREIRKFSRLLDKQLILISENPPLYPISDKSINIRKSVLTKYTTIYYKVIDKEIHLVTLFDNRQNPDKLKLD